MEISKQKNILCRILENSLARGMGSFTLCFWTCFVWGLVWFGLFFLRRTWENSCSSDFARYTNLITASRLHHIHTNQVNISKMQTITRLPSWGGIGYGLQYLVGGYPYCWNAGMVSAKQYHSVWYSSHFTGQHRPKGCMDTTCFFWKARAFVDYPQSQRTVPGPFN